MTYTILTRGNVHSSRRGSIGPRVLTLEWPQAAPATSTTQRRAVVSGSCHIPVVANLKEREVAIWEAWDLPGYIPGNASHASCGTGRFEPTRARHMAACSSDFDLVFLVMFQRYGDRGAWGLREEYGCQRCKESGVTRDLSSWRLARAAPCCPAARKSMEWKRPRSGRGLERLWRSTARPKTPPRRSGHGAPWTPRSKLA
jgi:hypothetical protein